MTYEDLTESQKRALFDAAVHLKANGPSHPTPLTQAVIDAISSQVIASDEELVAMYESAYKHHGLNIVAADTWKRAAKEAFKVNVKLAADMRAHAAQALKGRP